MTILPAINNPSDLKKLALAELDTLAGEIREMIIEVVSRNGGHLSPSLGVVELTIALHRCFDSPNDRLIWDVGHQSYAHKILTGRRDSFHTLRQSGGISGFPRTEESEHDRFNVGHSSTSISAAAGIAEAMRLKGEKGKVVAVIGDGSLTAGLAFEGLNQSGNKVGNLIVVLNDNEMSISKSVGSISSWLSRKLTSLMVTNWRKETKTFLRSLPHVGEPLVNLVHRALESSKALLTPGLLFEGLGFEYIGPIDGHRIDRLIEAFDNARNMERPVLVHVRTKKGKGYGPSEKDPCHFHGVGPFDQKTGKPYKKKKVPPSYTRVFGKTIVELAEKDDKIIGITAAMPSGTGLEYFAERFPGRFHDVGIAEQHGLVFAAGLAIEGFKPVVAIYSTFMQRAYDQVIHDVCLQDLPVVLAMDRAGLVGEDGPTHHGVFDLSYLRSIPNLVIAVPRDENQLRHLLLSGINCRHPFALRYPRGAGEGVSLDGAPKEIEIGKGEILLGAPGMDVVILGAGPVLYKAITAARDLEKEGIGVAIGDLRFIKPLDEHMILDLVKPASLLVTIEENASRGGMGSAVLELLAHNNAMPYRVKNIGIPDRFIPHGPAEALRRKCGLSKEHITEVIRRELCQSITDHAAGL
ncbi:MAG: 1-deoxy-D-xylulose-5-phosphate synthase [Deltaproteobacteria bacterium]|nr:1-deoxy-D-xylulose-5-phosphate synthase [Deltaproteobacteria bacterium]